MTVLKFTPRWEAPPPRRTGRQATAYKLAKSISRRPGQWMAVAMYDVYTSAHHRASQIRRGNVKGFAEVGTFEADVRLTPEGYVVYVRCTYVKSKERERGQDA